jgi:PII-like signaling protein
MQLFKAAEVFELMAQRARRHWALSGATRAGGIGGHGAESEISKVAVYMAF